MTYDDTFGISAPALQVRIRPRKRSTRSMVVRARLDTGADISAIPSSAVAILRLRAKSSVNVARFDGTPMQLDTYFVMLEIRGHIFENVRVISSQRLDMLLGLDLLNRFRVTLDGPAQEFEMVVP